MQDGHTRRRWLRAAAGLLVAGTAARAASAEVRPLKGSRAPAPRQALDMQGQPRPVPVPGRATVLNFWASWCDPCRHEMPGLQVAAELYGDRLAVQAVNFKEHPRTVARFLRSSAVELPVLLDPAGQVAAAWSVKVFPTTVLLAADGSPRWRVVGELDWTGREAGRLIESLWA
jgi:thiol-disulfide isomerase/thioredoxin